MTNTEIIKRAEEIERKFDAGDAPMSTEESAIMDRAWEIRENLDRTKENTIEPTADEDQSNYLKYRGKCKELSEALVKEDPTLTLVRGHYYCPLWNVSEPHWWCKKPDGTIVDPSALQFPSRGQGMYEEFNGIVTCAECGKEIKEEEADIEGNYAFCSMSCHMRFVGLGEYV